MIGKINFAGQREDRNNVDKLRLQTNAINFNNQRNITQSIENLSKTSSESNINFLMNVAQSIRYGLNCGLDDLKPNNNWMELLRRATEKSIANNNSPAAEGLKARFKQVFENNSELTREEKNILALRENILNTPGLKNKIKTSENDNVRNISKNLDYFVISSEVSVDEKSQVLDKLNLLMSKDYKIDKQLKDKKPQVLGELLNDLVVKTAEEDRPTIKQVDQRHHGMCAAISIARKAMAYEYKPQYVNLVMEELSESPEMEVYDITKLGTGAKVKVEKTPIDFNYAEDKGYRIIDASTLQWMNIAGTNGNGTGVSSRFSAFDKKYFDTFHDARYNRDFGDPVLDSYNSHLRALSKANESASSTLRMFENRKHSALEQYLSSKANAAELAQTNRRLAVNLQELMPNADEKTVYETVNELTHLNQDKENKFYIVDAEEAITKKAKIKKFIESKNPSVDKKVLDSKMGNIFNLYNSATEIIEYTNKEIEPKSQKAKMMKYYKPLYTVAATYRTSVDFGLNIKENLQSTAKNYGLPETATKEEVMAKMEKAGVIVPENILRGLQEKYNKIAKYAAVVEKAEVKGDNVNIEGLYDISKQEAAALKNVDKDLKELSKYLNKQMDGLLDMMEEPLNAQAKQIGLETGSYWISKEGESGLCTPQEIRIFEQMTGKRFYAEMSVDKTVDKIKNSNYSGISGTSVYHNQQGGHAMYIADVAPVQVKNPKTGKMETKDAIMHDNTWGYAEKKNNWIDSNGLERTDYACGRGGDKGYITNSLWQNGVLADDFKNKVGRIVTTTKTENGNIVKNVRTFRMFFDSILPATFNLAEKDARSFVEAVFSSSELFNQRLDAIVNDIKAGKVSVQDLNVMKLRAKSVSKMKESYSAYNKNILSGIKTEADWNKLDAKEPVKFLMERVAVANAYDSSTAYNYAMNIKSPEDLKKVDATLHYVALKDFVTAIKQTPVEDLNLNEYQIQFLQTKQNDSGRESLLLQRVKQWIDKTYDPVDNEAFVAKFRELKSLSQKELVKLVKENTTKEDLGINRKSAYETLKAYRNLDPDVKSTVDHYSFVDVLNNVVGLTHSGASDNEYYYVLKRDMESFELNKQLKPLMKPYLKNFGVRPAFPNYSLFNEEEVKLSVQQILQTVKINVGIIKQIPDAETKKLNQDVFNKDMVENIALNVDKLHRNRVAHVLNKYISEVVNDGKHQEKYAKEFEKEVLAHSILKSPAEIMDEYLQLCATGENPQREQSFGEYMNIIAQKVAGYGIHTSIMDAVSNGTAHEIGQELMRTDFIGTSPDGQVVNVKLADSDDAFVDFQTTVSDLTSVATAATIFNTIGLSDKIMKAIKNSINFEELAKKFDPKNAQILAWDLQDKINFVSALNLKNFPEVDKIRQVFLKDCFSFFKKTMKLSVKTL